MSSGKPDKALLDQYAEATKRALAVPQQSAVFRAAIEAGYLTALADGDMDAGERAMLVKSIDTLSSGIVIEWEIDALLEEINEHIGAEGPNRRCELVGEKLKELGQPEAGLMVAALVALATNGIDKREVNRLEMIGKAAGLERAAIAELVKKARVKA